MSSIIDKSHSKLGPQGGYDLDILPHEQKICHKLSLRRNYINDADMLLEDFTALTWLCLSANALTMFPKCLSNIPNLEHLYISNNKITAIQHLEKCVKLVTLEIRHNQLTDISGINHLTKLSSFSVSGNNISELKPDAFPQNIEFVGLFGNKLSDLDEILSVLSSLKCLKKTFIGANPFCHSLPLKEIFNVSVDYSQLSNGVKRFKYDAVSLNFQQLLALIKEKCPSIVNIDNNILY